MCFSRCFLQMKVEGVNGVTPAQKILPCSQMPSTCFLHMVCNLICTAGRLYISHTRFRTFQHVQGKYVVGPRCSFRPLQPWIDFPKALATSQNHCLISKECIKRLRHQTIAHLLEIWGIVIFAVSGCQTTRGLTHLGRLRWGKP